MLGRDRTLFPRMARSAGRIDDRGETLAFGRSSSALPGNGGRSIGNGGNRRGLEVDDLGRRFFALSRIENGSDNARENRGGDKLLNSGMIHGNLGYSVHDAGILGAVTPVRCFSPGIFCTFA